MRRRSFLPLAAAALFVAGFVTIPGDPADAVQGAQTERLEAFSPDGTISRVQVAKQTYAPPDAQDRRAAAAAEVVAIQNTGPSSARFDLVIVGDGYTASEMELLRSHAEAQWNGIAATEPWDRHRGSVNVWLVNVVSNESGVDNDPSEGINRDTALDMHFFCGGIERLLCLDEAKAQSFARQAPEVEAILAVGNTTKYGGAGYPSLATVSGGNVHAARIAIHELAHSVGGLADEYYDPGTTYSGGEPSEPNVTTDPSGSRWASYEGQSTPDGGVIGAYQGGRYFEYGLYRPSEDSLMRNIDKPFNLIGLDVMDQAIRSKISGGGGTG